MRVSGSEAGAVWEAVAALEVVALPSNRRAVHKNVQVLLTMLTGYFLVYWHATSEVTLTNLSTFPSY